MATAPRIVVPELLDALDPSDARARRSRLDLRRVHRIMASLSILKRAILQLRLARPPRRILELGAGDATLLLRLAQSMDPPWREVSLTVLDRHDLVSAETRDAYQTLGWQVAVLRKDALEWAMEQNPRRVDLCVTSLFLHHFDDRTLPSLMRAIAMNSEAFIACEPRRSNFARVGSHLIGLLGTNRVTREDAVKSVTAGFRGQELTALWPLADTSWNCEEYGAPPFTHCFTAVRRAVQHE